MDKFRKRLNKTNDVNLEFHRTKVIDSLKSVQCVIEKIPLIRISYKSKNLEKSLKRKLKVATRHAHTWTDDEWSDLFIKEIAKYNDMRSQYLSAGGSPNDFL